MTEIETIILPSNLVKLDHQWYGNFRCLKSISIDSKNPFFASYNNKIILTKSSDTDENYNILAFSIQNIKKIVIPSFIEIISADVFNRCKELQQVEFEDNSRLRIIETFAFYSTPIEKITLPSSLTKIGQKSFYECKKLQRVNFPINSKLQVIEKDAFNKTSLNCFVVPSSVTSICKGAFHTNKLQIIEINDNSQLQLSECAFYQGSDLIIMIHANAKTL